MTDDEQEALSFRYVMPRIMRLSSGRWALFVDGAPLRIITDPDELHQSIPTIDEIEAYQESLRASRPKAQLGPLKTLNLADLGL